MKTQLTLLPKAKKQHGGSLALSKRRSRRPLNTKQSLHITLKSHHAIGGRCLFRHKKLIRFTMRKAARLFNVKVYEYAIQGNHLHLLIKGPDRESLQNFFRVFAGHTAQNILKLHPLKPKETETKPRQTSLKSERGGALTKKGCKKNQRKFWSYLLYSRIVSWGREFKTVAHYIHKNTLEALGLLAYDRRTSSTQLAKTQSKNVRHKKRKAPA